MLKMVCATCGGENVMRDAWAEWDIESQTWTLQNVFDAAHCDDCEGECHIDEEPADPAAPPDVAPSGGAASDYLARFPADHRATADRAYQDGFADGANASD